jgi:short-subunit dehydrogenase
MNPRITDWQGLRVWIVGASSGIGEALARDLAARGARVALSARRRELLDRLAAELPESLALPCDAADPAALAAAACRLDELWQGIDVAIYAAGVWHPVSATEFDGARIDATLDINLRGAMHFAAVLAPRLLRRGEGTAGHGRALAFVGSVAGYRPLPRALLYGTSKAALNYFAGALHLDLAPRGVGVFLINPGFVETPMTAVNDFPMPGQVTVERAVREIVAGFARGSFEIHFPRRLSWTLKALGLLPDGLYFPLMRKLTRGDHAKT